MRNEGLATKDAKRETKREIDKCYRRYVIDALARKKERTAARPGYI